MRVHIPNTDYDVLIRFECDVYKFLASGGSKGVALVSVETPFVMCKAPDDRHIAHAPISKAFVGGAKIEHMPAHTNTRVIPTAPNFFMVCKMMTNAKKRSQYRRLRVIYFRKYYVCSAHVHST